MEPFSWWLAAQTSTAPGLGLETYGPLGLVLTIALGAIGVLFRREVQAHDRERTRADRLEAQYEALSKEIRDQHVRSLEQATRAIEEVQRIVRHQER